MSSLVVVADTCIDKNHAVVNTVLKSSACVQRGHQNAPLST